jgi:hypothetical protein
MSLKNLIVSGAAALALMGSAAIAATSNPNPGVIHMEQDGTGDYLLTPVYYAVSNWSTELKVVNTNTTKAVVAKVVIREARESNEIIDFVIYLTPGDVWTGTIYDDNGIVKVKSDDDSFIIGGKQGANVPPIGIHPLVETGADGGKHTAWHGYVEIFGLATYDPQAIVDYYNAHMRAPNEPLAQLGPCNKLDKMIFYKVVKEDTSLRDLGDEYTTDVTNDTLMGKATIFANSSDVNGRRTMMLNMLALGDVSDDAIVDQPGVYGSETKLNTVTSKGQIQFITELSKALAKRRIMVMYEGNGQDVYPTRIHFTDIVKKYYNTIAMIDGSGYSYEDYYNDDTPTTNKHFGEYYYTLNPDGTEVVFRNNTEDCNKCQPQETEVSGMNQGKDCTIKIHEEVHFFQPTDTNSVEYDAGAPMRELAWKAGGWADFNISNNDYNITINDNTITLFKGLPIVPTTFYAKDVQGIYLNNWLYNQYEVANQE